MIKDDLQIPEALKKPLRAMFLSQLKDAETLDVFELDLFAWYVRATEDLLDEMLSAERAYIQEQVDAGLEDVNDSGMVAVEYYLKKVRYSQAIYMTSLLETFLERSCERLTTAVGAHNLPFTTRELKGDQWSVRRKFLERYGKFTIPDELWSDIQAMISLRNNLVHDNGSTSELKPDERKMLAKQPGINLDGHEIAIEAEYVRSTLEAFKSLVQFVETKISEVIDRAIQPRSIP